MEGMENAVSVPGISGTNGVGVAFAGADVVLANQLENDAVVNAVITKGIEANGRPTMVNASVGVHPNVAGVVETTRPPAAAHGSEECYILADNTASSVT